ncbi:hypothetical protein KKG45_11310 [bacterium]|nr:hypothetical protein [bacterium]MBU1073822.1 hypothetical protein [bacterium]MBU1674423.1 hypothetical protein [bacterium]
MTPKSEKTSDGESGGDGGRTELHGRSHVQQTLHHLDQSVRQRIKEALQETEFDAQARDDIRNVEREFKVDLNAVFHEATDGHVVDASFLAEGVRDAITALTDSLRITLDGLLPPVPWEAEMPPVADEKGSLTVVQDMSTGLDKLA